MDDSWRCGVILPWRADATLSAVAVMAYSWVNIGLVIHLCLKKNPDILGVHVYSNYRCQHR